MVDGEPPKKKRSALNRVLLFVSVILLIIALAGLGAILWEYFKGDRIYESLSQYGPGEQAQVAEDPHLLVDWDTLSRLNPDIVAWVTVPGTKIDYPVVQAEDNDYYLHTAFDGTQTSGGAIFLDSDSAGDFSDEHSILYGHNMRNGSMFKDISKFSSKDYFDEHRDVLLLTPDKTYYLKTITAYVANGSEKLRQTEFNEESPLSEYIQKGLVRCTYSLDVDPEKIDHLFTLATCSYQTNDARTIVHAIEVEKDGDIETQ